MEVLTAVISRLLAPTSQFHLTDSTTTWACAPAQSETRKARLKISVLVNAGIFKIAAAKVSARILKMLGDWRNV